MSEDRYDDDDDRSPFLDAVLSTMWEVFRGLPQDPDVPRDSFLWRWAKFFSLTILLAMVVGAGFFVEEYVMMANGGTTRRKEVAYQRIRHESMDSARKRFLVGAGIGGGIGAAFVIRCLILKVDP